MHLQRDRRRTLKQKGASRPEPDQIEVPVTHDEAIMPSVLTEALQESERRYRLLAENLTDVICTTDLNLNLAYVSPSITRMIGYSVEEVMAMTIEEILTPDSFEVATKTLAEELAIESTGQKDPLRSRTLELEINCKDGSTVWTEAKMTFLRDSDTQPIGIVGVLRDITERKQMEEAQWESEAKYREIASNIPGVVYQFMLNKDGSTSFPFVSEVCSAVIGLTPEEIKSDPSLPFRMIVADDFDRVNQSLAESVQAMNTGTAEFRMKTRTGETKWLRASSSPRLLPDGSLLWDGIILDITERIGAEEERERTTAQLLQAQKMEAIGTLAGGIAHDFNNLITAIQGYADIAMTEVYERHPLYRHLKGIDAACSRAARLTRQLLLFGRKNSAEAIPLNINGIIEELSKMLKRLIGEHIAIHTYLEPDIFQIWADAGNIEQVIMNLAVNARDAMPDGGKLTITTENVTLSEEKCKTIPEARPGRYVCLSVADTGVGMDEKTIQYIFEPFFSTKEPGEGTGLGLSVVYGIAKQHEGWINVYSEPGQGSTFKLYLPAVPGKPEAKTKDTILVQELQGNGERILLVEDEERVREFLADVLSGKGHAVFEAANAKEALDIFDSEKGNFNLVFSDVLLPDMSGLQLVDQLRSRKPELPVLLGSGWVNDELKWPTIRGTRIQLLQKPYELAELLEAVRETMAAAQG